MTGLSSSTSIGMDVECTQVCVQRCFSLVYDDLRNTQHDLGPSINDVPIKPLDFNLLSPLVEICLKFEPRSNSHYPLPPLQKGFPVT